MRLSAAAFAAAAAALLPLLLLLLAVAAVGTAPAPAAAHATARFGAAPPPSESEDGDGDRQTAQWFTQTLDHFGPGDGRTFRQRYYVESKFWGGAGSPVFAIFSGEGPCGGIGTDPAASLVARLAARHGALLVTLEHRFFGLSVPFGMNTSTPHLRFLSPQQALADMAQFLAFVRSSVPGGADAPLVNFGGSYSGALSAWFRLKYPHITRGAVASSAVVNPVLAFYQFDQLVQQAAGEECTSALRATTKQVELAMKADANATRARFQASSLVEAFDFYYFLGDMMAESVQYGFRANICDAVVPPFKKSGASPALVDAIVKYAPFWMEHLNGGPPVNYGRKQQQKEIVGINDNYRQWWWIKCTTLAYFQIAPASDSIRSSVVDLDGHIRHCSAVFGIPNMVPNVNETIRQFGSVDYAGTRVYFDEGSQDPWRGASVYHAPNPDTQFGKVTCQNCGHCCADRGCPGGCDTPNNLAAIQDEITDAVASWLK